MKRILSLGLVTLLLSITTADNIHAFVEFMNLSNKYEEETRDKVFMERVRPVLESLGNKKDQEGLTYQDILNVVSDVESTAYSYFEGEINESNELLITDLKIKLRGILTSMYNVEVPTRVFSDVQEHHWAYSDIQEMVSRGVLEGYPDGKFGPNDKLTGEQFVLMVTRLYDLTDEQRYIILDRFDNTDTITREEASFVLSSLLVASVNDVSTDSIKGYIDVDSISDEYKKYLVVCVDYNLIRGITEIGSMAMYLEPKRELTRAEAVTILSRMDSRYIVQSRLKNLDTVELDF